ncbi:hypothetical protein AVEN_175496-1 [Araneus ventricosus]|uniref:C2H2-type domain-containing protein n=1 Tax=Araneus ventricosus TaxID=182803 RepID=A0A4Y2NJF8_ARAVE|nr:hypothetical protein AVEN_175496-1 [Araneus ventricosus]
MAGERICLQFVSKRIFRAGTCSIIIESKPDGRKPFACGLVAKEYLTRGGHLNKHYRTHDGENLVCDLVSKGFSWKAHRQSLSTYTADRCSESMQKRISSEGRS